MCLFIELEEGGMFLRNAGWLSAAYIPEDRTLNKVVQFGNQRMEEEEFNEFSFSQHVF
jgi:hypothetical protein